MNFEKQIARIASKAELHALIDQLPDNACAAVLAFLPDDEIVRTYYFPNTLNALEIIGLNDIVHRYTGGSTTVGGR